MDVAKLLEVFFSESDELIADLEAGLLALERTPGDVDVVHRLFRAAHTLKSNARMLCVEPIVELAHAMESVLDTVRTKRQDATSPLVGALLAAVDVLKEMVRLAATQGDASTAARYAETCARLASFAPRLSDTTAAPRAGTEPPSRRGFRIVLDFRSDALEAGVDPAVLLEQLSELGELERIEASLDRLPPFEALAPTKLWISWRIRLRTSAPRAALDGVFLFVPDHSKPRIEPLPRPEVDPNVIADKWLGELLVDEGAVRPSDVAEVLARQKRIGELLVDANKLPRHVLDQVLAKQEAARRILERSSIRVDTSKLDALFHLVGELVIAVARANRAARDAGLSEAARSAITGSLERVTREMQETVLSLRMVPLEQVFNRLKRTVRELASELCKDAVLTTAGDDTQLDKHVIEQLVDPLTHLIRNCMDHGMERPKARIAAGKSPTGAVHVRAEQRDGSIVIEVGDDGPGIDVERVRERALAAGIVSADQVLDERQIMALVFEPGLSTAQHVSGVSGRGVGLDVVRSSVAKLGGSVEVCSERGRGTTFRIVLPLALAQIDALCVEVGTQALMVPMRSVLELMIPPESGLETVDGTGQLIELRGERMPIVRLDALLDLVRSPAPPTNGVIVLVASERRRFGLLVDRVMGIDQAVVGPRETSRLAFLSQHGAERPPGIARALILADGRVCLILDVHGLDQMAFGAHGYVERAPRS